MHGMLKNLALYGRDTTSAKFKDISRQLLASVIDICCNKRTLVDESGMIRTQIGTHNTSENGRSGWEVL
jgi:hypothetical protein